MRKKYKVALIHNIISPYRVPLFEGLSNHPSIDLFVYFCSKTHKIRKWDILESDAFNYEVLSGSTLEFRSITYHLNPSIVAKLINGKYDAVILSGNPDFTTHISYLTCRLFRIPIIWWTEGIESSQSKMGFLISPFTKHIVKSVNAIVVPGSLSRDFCLKMGANSEKIFIAPNIVDNELFIKKSTNFKKDEHKLKQNCGLDNKKIILYVGQLVERKGVDDLINAYNRLKHENDDVCLVIIGDGILREKLEIMCSINNIKDVYFKGWVSDDEKYIYYSISDLFVLPTLRDVWGLVINEAMCCGLPIISTTAAGASCDMILNGENGYIVSPKNVDQLYVSIKKIILDNYLIENMSKKSLSIILDNYTIENTLEGFVSSIEYALRNQNNRNIRS